MSNNFSWSANAGRWMGVPVRIHMFVFLFIALIFGIGSNLNLEMFTAIVTVFVLLGSILIHELAHAFAVTNLGGNINNLQLMPWGGESEFALPVRGLSRATVYLAGPFVNCSIALFGALVLIQSTESGFLDLVNPFNPHVFTAEWEISLIKIVTWINFQLAMFNMLPCYPFDGAKVFRGLVDASDIDLPKYRVETAIKLIGHTVAFGFIGMAWIFRNLEVPGLLRPWTLMLMLGITLLFAARYSLHKETQTSDDWDDMEDIDYGSIYGSETSFFDSAHESDNSAYSQWLTEKQEERRELELQREEQEDRLADEILEKLHKGGIASISDEEKAILDRVSERIRKRRQQGV